MVEKRLWDNQCPLHQFRDFSQDVLRKLDSSRVTLEDMLEMQSDELGLIFVYLYCSFRNYYYKPSHV